MIRPKPSEQENNDFERAGEAVQELLDGEWGPLLSSSASAIDQCKSSSLALMASLMDLGIEAELWWMDEHKTRKDVAEHFVVAVPISDGIAAIDMSGAQWDQPAGYPDRLCHMLSPYMKKKSVDLGDSKDRARHRIPGNWKQLVEETAPADVKKTLNETFDEE